MSENTTQNTTTTDDAPKAAKKSNAPKLYSIGAIAQVRAKHAGHGDVSRSAKEVRALLRKNFDRACALQPSIKKVKSAANDGNRWPALSDRVVKELNLAGPRKK
jgi:hypothetical protein